MTPLISHSLVMLVGVLLAWLGGELLVRGTVGVARWAGWPASIVGATIAAFGTSSPELMVGIQSALAGTPQISLGDVLGSNIANVSLVLALPLLMYRMTPERASVRRDFTAALAVPLLIAIVAWDGKLARAEGWLLLAAFAVWLAVLVLHARKNRITRTEPGPPSPARPLLLTLGGLVLLIISAKAVVSGGVGVAHALGWSTFIVGAVVVALATSTPELATTIVSIARGHHDVGVGTIIGSNIFNGWLIAAIVMVISPFTISFAEILPSLVLGVLTILAIWPGKNGDIGRPRGVLLLSLYAVYLAWSLAQAQDAG